MIRTPVMSIRKMCLSCMGSSSQRVNICSATNCDLWYWRFGKRPSTLKKESEAYFDKDFFQNTAHLSEKEVIRLFRKKVDSTTKKATSEGF